MNLSGNRSALLMAVKLIALACAIAGLARLGVWQCHRGQQKQALIDAYESGLRAEPMLLTAAFAAAHAPQWTSVTVRGRYIADRQLLLDNQVHAEQPGFDVWTPLRSDDGDLIVIDRGWMPLTQRMTIPPPPSGPLDLHGLWRTLPEPGLRLGADNCAPQSGPPLVEYPTAADLQCRLGRNPVAGVVLLDDAAPGGFVRDWHPSEEFPPMRHYAYAMQWFALAATLLILSLRFMLKHPR